MNNTSKVSQLIIRLANIMILLMILVCVTSCKNEGATYEESTFTIDASPSAADYDNSVNVLTPVFNSSKAFGNEYITMDSSNSSEGYFTIKYLGNRVKAKILFTGPGQTTYSYCIYPNEPVVIPITDGDGSYEITVYENIQDTEYALCFTTNINVTIENTFGPFLYPNIYVDFNKDTKAVEVGKEITGESTSQLNAVYDIYSYITDTLTYDYEKAETAESGYIPDVDDILESGKGICLDYAALMCTMLRSQGIPARMEIGYAGAEYHAWLSVYTEDSGWIDNLIEFNGTDWTLMDPTFASNQSAKDFKKFFKNQSNYIPLYNY